MNHTTNLMKPTRGGARPGAGRKTLYSTARAPKKRSQRPPTPFQLWRADPGRALSELCDEIVNGSSLNRFVIARGFAYSTVADWLRADTVRWDIYWRACEDRADVFADEIVKISDEVEIEARTEGSGRVILAVSAAAVERNRLRIDARKWTAARMALRPTKNHAKTLEERLASLPSASSDPHTIDGKRDLHAACVG